MILYVCDLCIHAYTPVCMLPAEKKKKHPKAQHKKLACSMRPQLLDLQQWCLSHQEMVNLYVFIYIIIYIYMNLYVLVQNNIYIYMLYHNPMEYIGISYNIV